MTIADVKKNTEQKMHKSIDTLKADLAKVRTGRAHTGILDHVMVDYYGTPTNITQVANITLVDARTIGVQPWEKKILDAIEKAIIGANIGITPMNDGTMVKLFMPPLTEERRKEFVKKAHVIAETARVSIRGIRRDAIEHIKKLAKDSVPEDEIKTGETKTQALTDKHIEQVEKHLAVKEKEIMTV